MHTYCTHLLHTPHTEEWVSEGALHLRTAFSRDQPEKVYVQHLITEDSKRLWELIQVYRYLQKINLLLATIHRCYLIIYCSSNCSQAPTQLLAVWKSEEVLVCNVQPTRCSTHGVNDRCSPLAK